MATKLSLEMEPGRGPELWKVNPEKLLLREEQQSRKYMPSDEQIAQLAISLYREGQLQPVLTRKVGEDMLEVVAGFCRTKAAILLRQGFTREDTETGGAQTYHQPEFKLEVRVTKNLNDQDAFLRNIAENNDRNEVSLVDHAYAHRRLRDHFGYTNAKIAKLYNMDAGKVGKIEKLLGLEEAEQRLVHDGHLSFQGALDLLDLPGEQRKEALEKAKGENGKVNGAVIRSIAREEALNGHSEEIPIATPVDAVNGEAPAEQPTVTPTPKEPAKKGGGKSHKLSMTEWRNEVEVLGGDPNPNIQKIAQVITLVLEGKRKGSALVRVLREAVGSK